MFYLTYAEPPSGVYASQVTDVIRYMNDKLNSRMRLVAFISMHDFSNKKKVIKKQLPDAIVLPMLPKAPYWKFNSIILALLCIIYRPRVIVARNVIACNMALKVKQSGLIKKVCFDGRGAIAAEWKEYEVHVTPSWKNAIDTLERNAVIKSQFRIAVSEKLVDYWKDVYGYTGREHVVIPCTLNSNFKSEQLSKEVMHNLRAKLGYKDDDILFAYSGSTAGWQSFSILHPFLSNYLKKDKRYKVLFLAPEDDNIKTLQAEYPEQVTRLWLQHNEVTGVLAACDLGILIREKSVTNKVASPTKFAEYLSVGLPVAISEELGDYTDFVRTQSCGFVVNGSGYPEVPGNTDEQRMRISNLVQRYCTKDAFLDRYRLLYTSLLS